VPSPEDFFGFLRLWVRLFLRLSLRSIGLQPNLTIWGRLTRWKHSLCTTNVCRRKFAQSGTDVMITIFCDFWQFSAKKLAFFSKNNVMVKFLHNLALFWVKKANYYFFKY
jgi:hypothetical protein